MEIILIIKSKKISNRQKQDAFLRLLQKHADLTYNVIRNHTASQSDIDDIFQKAWFKLFKNDYEKIKKFQGKSKFSSWLYTVVRYETLNHNREIKEFIPLDKKLENEQGSEVEMVLEDSAHLSAQSEAEKNEEEKILKQSIEELDPRSRLVIFEIFIRGAEREELARILGVSRNAVDIIIHRAKKKIEDSLRKRGISL